MKHLAAFGGHSLQQEKRKAAGHDRARCPLTIAFFVPWMTAGNFGGTERVGAQMANSMAARGHRTFMHTFNDRPGTPTYPLDHRIELRQHPEKPSYAMEMQLLVELAAQRPDVIVGLHMNRTFFTYVWCAARLGIPVILSEHCPPELPRSLGRFGEREREIVFSGAERLHFLTPHLADTLPQALHDRVRVIPNTVTEPKNLAEPGDDARRSVLTVARLVGWKQIDLLIEAFALVSAKHSGWTLRIAGDGPERGRLEALAEARSLAERVRFLGKIQCVYHEFETASVFCLPSTSKEGFPLSSLEAMAHGLPIVGLRENAGLMAQVRDGKTALMCGEADPKQLAERLDQLMSSPQTRASMGASGRQHFLSHFDEGWIAEQWADLFHEAAALRRESAAPDGVIAGAVHADLKERLHGSLASYYCNPL